MIRLLEICPRGNTIHDGQLGKDVRPQTWDVRSTSGSSRSTVDAVKRLVEEEEVQWSRRWMRFGEVLLDGADVR
jgi:hypothetical protein